MSKFNPEILKKLYIPPANSHKGDNGKVMIIAGSHLFHSAALWPLTVASRIVDMVFFSSIPMNNEIVKEQKKEFRNGIIVPRENIEDYLEEAECILIGPGLMRTDGPLLPTVDYNLKNLDELSEIGDEGIQTYYLTKYLLKKYKEKRFVVDGGSLQMMDSRWLVGFKNMPILTPHHKEFETLFKLPANGENVKKMAEKHNCVILLKGPIDFICSPKECVQISGGNAGMTKGGTGDVLAGLVAALYSKNESFLSAAASSFINKKAGENLSKKVGLYFNASDLANEIPVVFKELI